MSAFFISDIHLSESKPELTALLLEFLEKINGDATSLYVLGDLFDFWMGDDVLDSSYSESIQPVITAFKNLTDNNCQLFFVQGNRDFLLGNQFMSAVGGILLPDESVILLEGKPTLLMHGDTLCTDDKAYLRMRRAFRWKWMQRWYLGKSLEKRAGITKNTQRKSSKKKNNKEASIMDVNQHAVEVVMRKHKVSQLIHGHTHRPDTHEFELDGMPVKRVVLSDWRDEVTFLKFGFDR